mgnify:CR=1 FL=1
MTNLSTPYRTHTCGQLRATDAGSPARLAGWVHRRRDHGQLIFLDLRDRHGLTQVVIDAADALVQPFDLLDHAVGRAGDDDAVLPEPLESLRPHGVAAGRLSLD